MCIAWVGLRQTPVIVRPSTKKQRKNLSVNRKVQLLLAAKEEENVVRLTVLHVTGLFGLRHLGALKKARERACQMAIYCDDGGVMGSITPPEPGHHVASAVLPV